MLTSLFTLAFVAVCFVLFTDVGRPPQHAPSTPPAGSGDRAGGVTPAHVTPTPGGNAASPLALSAADAATARLSAADVSAAGRGERAPQAAAADNTGTAQGAVMAGVDSFAPPPAAGSAQPQATPAVSAASLAAGAAQSARPRTAGYLARPLSLMGHRVHATLSGEGQSTTLSVTGATLTREDAVRWIGSGGARRELKAAGVRVVVVVGGSESWTFML